MTFDWEDADEKATQLAAMLQINKRTARVLVLHNVTSVPELIAFAPTFHRIGNIKGIGQHALWELAYSMWKLGLLKPEYTRPGGKTDYERGVESGTSRSQSRPGQGDMGG